MDGGHRDARVAGTLVPRPRRLVTDDVAAVLSQDLCAELLDDVSSTGSAAGSVESLQFGRSGTASYLRVQKKFIGTTAT